MSDLHEAIFTWPGLDASDVVLTGTFDDWSCSVHPTKGPTGFVARVRIPWGTRVQYKWIVDSVWRTDSAHATDYDPVGNINNVYGAPPRPPSPAPAEAPAEAPAMAPEPTPASTPGPTPASAPPSDPQTLAAAARDEVSSSKADEKDLSIPEPLPESKPQEEPPSSAVQPSKPSNDVPPAAAAAAAAPPVTDITTQPAPIQVQDISPPVPEPSSDPANDAASTTPPLTPTTVVATPTASAPGTLTKSERRFPATGADVGSPHKAAGCDGGHKGPLTSLKGGDAAAEGSTTTSRKKRHSLFGKLKHLFDHHHHDSDPREKSKQDKRR